MIIGSLVWNHYHGILRFGTITKKMIGSDGWAYYHVNWHCDDNYERAMKERERFTHTDYTLEKYRQDQIHTFPEENFLEIASLLRPDSSKK
tara:strand:- start:204 stop:476 length:273 start_codon:yes stop_codon:yes gene_type:complete